MIWDRLFKWKATKAANTLPGESETNELEFDTVIDQISRLSIRAHLVFMRKLIDKLPVKVLKSTRFYIKQRLDNDRNHQRQRNWDIEDRKS